ncbi:MAG: PAS domain-containing protein [Candidatus Saccharimonas sp.]|nr:MAG: PAS domain-containing protein [Candidatus Saccharimonas sp.]
MLAFLLIFESDYVKLFTSRKWAMFNLKNIFSENSENKKNTPSSFLGDGKAILDAVDDGVLAVDSKGNILAINPAAEQITGWNGSDAAGLVFNSVLKITNNEGGEMIEISNPVNRVLQTGENFTTRDLFIKTQSGKIVPIFLAVNSIDGQNSGVVVVFRDISKELKENREQAEFISTASHEMRTPVASIEGYIGLALNPATATIDARAKSYLQKAHENTKHLGQLFQDLLDITKAEDGRLKNEPVVLDAIEFSRNIWEGLKPKAEAKGLNYIFEPDNHKTGEKTLTPVFFIHADRDHLHEILNNLFENAIKYTPSGMVSVNVMGDNNNVQISVKDSGIGIPAEDIPHLFQKFYRVDNSETREINGTGLGLFLSRKLTESIGGFLDVESEYKKGSTFTVKLPRITRENAEKLKAIEDTKKAEEYQKIEQKNNQREIDEADRDITAILEDPKIENPSEEVFEITQEIQPETSISIPETIPQNTQPENSQVQQAPYTQNTTESTQQQEQQIYDNFVQNTAPIPQPNVVITGQNQPAQKVIQAQQDFSKYGAIQGFSPLAGAQNQDGQNSAPNLQTVQNYDTQIADKNLQQNTQAVQNNYSPQSSIDTKNQQFQPPQMTETTQNIEPQPSQHPSNQPTLNDIERMKIEYAQKMMNQRKN